MIRIAIVEDEKSAAEKIEGYIQQFSKEKNIECEVTYFTNGIDFVSDYRSLFDIVLLDIEMPHMDGLETAKRLRQIDQNVCIIFVTNMAQYAIKGYEVSALDFMVKPVKYFDFFVKLQKAISYVEANSDFSLVLETKDSIRKVSVREIRYVEVYDHWLIFHLAKENVTVRGKIKDMEETLSAHNFSRCHNCYLINLKCVTELTANYVVVAGEEIQVSRRRRKEFSERLTNFLGGV